MNNISTSSEPTSTPINPQQPVENSEMNYADLPAEDYIFPTPAPIDPSPMPVEENHNEKNEADQLVDFTQPVAPFNLTDDQDFANPTTGAPISNNYAMSSNVKLDENGDIEVPLPSANQKFVTADMKTVINTIRDCAATIEKYGFKIDTEEIDLEDSYQVIFKIDKNV